LEQVLEPEQQFAGMKGFGQVIRRPPVPGPGVYFLNRLAAKKCTLAVHHGRTGKYLSGYFSFPA